MRRPEVIGRGQRTLAYVIRADATADTTEFFTPEESAFQAGFVVHEAGGQVIPHLHLPVERQLAGTSELLLVRSGRCIVDVYDDDRQLVASRLLGPGDAVLSVAGGHGFRMLERTVLLEVKQGPYTGATEKERFPLPLASREAP